MPEYITLFNDERYQRCNLRPGERLFRYDHQIGGRAIGTLAGVIGNGIVECGHSAPYGGIDFTRPRVFAGVVVDLVRGAGAAAARQGAGTTLVRTRPSYHGENDTATVFALFGLGATVRACELSLGLETWRYRTPEDYVKSLKDSARCILHRGLRARLEFAAVEGEEEWSACYRLLAETRERRGARALRQHLRPVGVDTAADPNSPACHHCPAPG